MDETDIDVKYGLIVTGTEDQIKKFRKQIPYILEGCKIAYQKTSIVQIFLTHKPPKDY